MYELQAFTFLCGTPVLPSMDMMIVEYFVDKDKAELHIQETKELQVCHVTTLGGGVVKGLEKKFYFSGDGIGVY